MTKENIPSDELLKQLIYERWQALQPSQTIFERRGGHPKHLLEDAPSDLSLRENRKRIVAEKIKQRHQTSHQGVNYES
jgi:hypothetical protein